MKIRILSDLHLDHSYYDHTYKYMGEDIVVLAGDMTADLHQLSDYISKIPVRTIIIPGNHEFYGHDFYPRLDYITQEFYQYNQIVAVDAVAFICTTAWSDFNITNGILNKNQRMGLAKKSISDFRCIRNGKANWTPKDCIVEHAKASNFLAEALIDTEGMQRVVVTHFLPSEKCISPMYKNSNLNSYFVSNLEKFMPNVDLWIHGHTHSSVDVKIGDTRIVCNSAGYGNENKYFNPNLIIEI